MKAEAEEAAEAMPSEEVEELRKDVQEVKKEMQVMWKEMVRELEGIRKELSGSREEVKTLRGNIADLAVKSAKQNERMTEAVELIMKMLKWLEKTLPLTQSKMLPGSSSEVKQTGQGSSSVQRPPHPLKQVVTPSVSKPVLIPSKSKFLMLKKPVSDQPEQEKEEEEPELPAKKKMKMTRPGIPPQSGSRGSQIQK